MICAEEDMGCITECGWCFWQRIWEWRQTWRWIEELEWVVRDGWRFVEGMKEERKKKKKKRKVVFVQRVLGPRLVSGSSERSEGHERRSEE